MRRAARRDGNEAELVKMARTLGGLWLPYGPLDGWVWAPKLQSFRPVEIKQPEREGKRGEYTDKQLRFFENCTAVGAPWWTWRLSENVLTCMQEWL